MGAEVNERLGQVRAHEPSAPVDEHGPFGEDPPKPCECAQLLDPSADGGGRSSSRRTQVNRYDRGAVRSILARLRQGDRSYESQLQAAVTRVVQPGWICADVGAHHGVFTRLLAELVGEGGTVVAFEAHPDNARMLRKSLSRSVCDRVAVENLAVTDGSAERVSLHAGRRHASEEWNIVGTDLEGRPTPAELEVGATSLDSYFAERPLHFVKLDVEGAEAERSTRHAAAPARSEADARGRVPYGARLG